MEIYYCFKIWFKQQKIFCGLEYPDSDDDDNNIEMKSIHENDSDSNEYKDDTESINIQRKIKRLIVKNKPNIKWSDVAGLDEAKQSLKAALLFTTKFPQMHTYMRNPCRGILLFGLPGTGKSLLVKALAAETDSTFYSVSSADLVSRWIGESEMLVYTLFHMARKTAPAIIFIDQVDSLCFSGSNGESEAVRRIKEEILVQMKVAIYGESDKLYFSGYLFLANYINMI